MAALGGLWQAAVFGFAGLAFHEDGISLAPQLPEAWRGMAFRVQWRGRSVHIRISRTDSSVTATLAGAPMTLRLGAVSHTLQRDRTARLALAAGRLASRVRRA